MADLIRRITVIHRGGEHPETVTVYREPRKSKKVSALTRPIERAARRLVRAQVVFGQEVIRRSDRANRRRKDGWLLAREIAAGRGRIGKAA
jgi:Family of unknown function (DUF6312)